MKIANFVKIVNLMKLANPVNPFHPSNPLINIAFECVVVLPSSVMVFLIMWKYWYLILVVTLSQRTEWKIKKLLLLWRIIIQTNEPELLTLVQTANPMTIQNVEPLEDFRAAGKTLNRKTWQMWRCANICNVITLRIWGKHKHST